MEQDIPLQILDLRLNPLTDECLKSLGEFIQRSETIKFVDIGNSDESDTDAISQISDVGIEILTNCIVGNTSLDHLSISGLQNVSETSIPHLTEMAKKTCITKLSIWPTALNDDIQNAIHEAFKTSIEKRDVPIKSNTKSASKRR